MHVLKKYKYLNSLNEAKLPEGELGCYIGVKFKQQTDDDFKEIGRYLLNESKLHEDYHATLIFSKCAGSFDQIEDVRLCPQFTIKNVTLKTKHLGKNNECLVLLIEHEWFASRHEYLKTRHNFSHDYSPYCAHVTLTYDDKDNVPDGLTYVVDLMLDGEYIETVNKDYV